MWDAPARRPPGRSSVWLTTGGMADAGTASSDRHGGFQRDRTGDRQGARRRGLRDDDVAARRPEKLEGAVQGLKDDGYEVQSLAANVADEAEIQKVVAAHRERYGRLDVLVNNAGVGSALPSAELQTKHADMQLNINLRSIVPLLPRVHADASRGRLPSTRTRWSSTPPRSPASAARAGCRSTRQPSMASSAGRKR